MFDKSNSSSSIEDTESFEDTSSIQQPNVPAHVPEKPMMTKAVSDSGSAPNYHHNMHEKYKAYDGSGESKNYKHKKKVPHIPKDISSKNELFTPTASYASSTNKAAGEKRERREKKGILTRANTSYGEMMPGELEAERNLTELQAIADRKGTKKSKKKSIRIDTSWGEVTITPSKTGSVYQMMTSTRREDFSSGTNRKKSNKKGDKWKEYKTWVKYLNKVDDNQCFKYSHNEGLDDYADKKDVVRQRARDIRDDIENGTIKPESRKPNPNIYNDNQNRAAALLYATIMHSEEYRVDGARELAIESLKRVEETGDFNDFVKTFTLSMPSGGAERARGIIDHTVIPNAEERKVERAILKKRKRGEDIESDTIIDNESHKKARTEDNSDSTDYGREEYLFDAKRDQMAERLADELPSDVDDEFVEDLVDEMYDQIDEEIERDKIEQPIGNTTTTTTTTTSNSSYFTGRITSSHESHESLRQKLVEQGKQEEKQFPEKNTHNKWLKIYMSQEVKNEDSRNNITSTTERVTENQKDTLPHTNGHENNNNTPGLRM